jgi:glycosyltransferase involved in cell wall biosynthesis
MLSRWFHDFNFWKWRLGGVVKLVHVVPHINEEAAGPSYSVPRLCQALAAQGHDVELSCLAARSQIPGVTLDIHPEWPIFKRFSISTSHAFAMINKANSVDVVHNHSLWSMVNMSVGWIVPSRKAKLITSPRGTLSEWALSRNRNLKNMLWPFQRKALLQADLLHATSEMEYAEIRNSGYSAPVAIIPNGVDVPDLSIDDFAINKNKTLLFLSRIHPKKGLDRLLMAWSSLQAKHPEWRLVIAGRGEPLHVEEVQELAENLKLERVDFPGALYGVDKSLAYCQASLFVLPTHSENFGMVVAEALAHGCPVVVSRGAPWSEIVNRGCGWWTSNEVGELELTLSEAMQCSDEKLMRMGSLGRDWMDSEYSWNSIGERMSLSYKWLIEGGTAPSWIRLD